MLFYVITMSARAQLCCRCLWSCKVSSRFGIIELHSSFSFSLSHRDILWLLVNSANINGDGDVACVHGDYIVYFNCIKASDIFCSLIICLLSEAPDI